MQRQNLVNLDTATTLIFLMDIVFVPFLSVVLALLKFYTFCVWGLVIMTWLEMFQIINRYNRLVYMAYGFFFRLVEPALLWIRKCIPSIKNLDLAPFLLLLGLFFIENVIVRILMRFPA